MIDFKCPQCNQGFEPDKIVPKNCPKCNYVFDAVVIDLINRVNSKETPRPQSDHLGTRAGQGETSVPVPGFSVLNSNPIHADTKEDIKESVKEDSSKEEAEVKSLNKIEENT